MRTYMLMSLGFIPGHRNVVFYQSKTQLCFKTCVYDRRPPGVRKTAIVSILIDSRDQMKCSIFSQNKGQIIDKPARKILVLSYITGQVHTQLSCQVELVAYIFCIRLHLHPLFLHGCSKTLSEPRICAG